MPGAGQLSTELTISADEFENYDIFATPISLAFHLREFNVSFLCPSRALLQPLTITAVRHLDQATIAYAESIEAILDVRFTDPAAALYVDVLSDGIEGLFAMSTSHVPGAPGPPPAAIPSQARSAGSSAEAEARTHKRPREGDTRFRTPAKVVERVEPARSTRQASGARVSHRSQASVGRPRPLLPRNAPEQPLFLPGSQMTAADQEVLDASGLGDMDVDEFNAMMEDEGEEVGLNMGPSDVLAPPMPSPPAPDLDLEQAVDWVEDDIQSAIGPTQSDESGRVRLLYHFCVRTRIADY